MEIEQKERWIQTETMCSRIFILILTVNTHLKTKIGSNVLKNEVVFSLCEFCRKTIKLKKTCSYVDERCVFYGMDISKVAFPKRKHFLITQILPCNLKMNELEKFRMTEIEMNWIRISMYPKTNTTEIMRTVRLVPLVELPSLLRTWSDEHPIPWS